MALNIATIDPQFIFISYDIKGKKGRRKFRETIKGLGAVKRNDSDYYMLFTTAAWEAMQRVMEKEGRENFNIEIIPSATTDDFANLLRDKYELAFIQQFEHAEERLDFLRAALAQEESTFVEDKKTGEKKPRTAVNLMHIIADVEHDIRVIEKAIGKRREFEQAEFQLDENRIKHYEALEKRIEAISLRADKYSGSIRAAAKREEKGYGTVPAIPVA